MSNENNNIEYIKVLSDIIETELNIKPTIGNTNPMSHRVWIYNQDFVLPTLDYMFIVLSENPGKVIANRNGFIGDGTDSIEQQEIIFQREIMIDIFSKNAEARQRKEEVLMALQSIYSQQQQELNGFRIFAYSTRFIDLSEVEGAGRINRYQCSVMLHCRYSKEKTVNNYGYFSNTIDVCG